MALFQGSEECTCCTSENGKNGASIIAYLCHRQRHQADDIAILEGSDELLHGMCVASIVNIAVALKCASGILFVGGLRKCARLGVKICDVAKKYIETQRSRPYIIENRAREVSRRENSAHRNQRLA